MPEIQGYNTGSKTSILNEVTITTSGTKFYLDTSTKLTGTSSTGEESFIGVDDGNSLFTTDPTVRELLEGIHYELLKTNIHLSKITDENVENRDILED
jgi:hypothetical protein